MADGVEDRSPSSDNDIDDDFIAHSNGDFSPVREEYNNAKSRLEQQRETLRAFAKESQRMLRITLIFVGILLTGASILASDFGEISTELPSCAIKYQMIGYQLDCILTISRLIALAAVGLSVSALFNLFMGNESKAVETYGQPMDIELALSTTNENDRAYLQNSLRRYHDRIKYNDGVIAALETNLAIGRIGLTLTILSFIVIAFAFIYNSIPTLIFVIVLAFLIMLSMYILRSLPEGYVGSANQMPTEFLTPQTSKSQSNENVEKREDRDSNE